MSDKALKAKTIAEKSKQMTVLTKGVVERIGHDDAIFTIKHGKDAKTKILPVKDHAEAVKLVLDGLIEEKIIASLDEIAGVGHRVVQGGPYFRDSHVFDEDTEEKIASLIPLDPLHAQAHLTCFKAFKNALPESVGEVAVFDTAFHQTMAPVEYMYALPYEYYEKYKVRRYGAHGTSHKYLSIMAKETYFPRKRHVNLITCHIGSGGSVSAIRDGKVVATSMGLTPLAGVMMGTRTGDIDASCMSYLCSCTGKSVDEMFDIYNHKSGLLGISGISNDTRDVEAAAKKGDERAKLAIDMYANSIANYLMMYYGKLGGKVDMIVCSAGVFENGPMYREETFKKVSDALGIRISPKANAEMVGGKMGLISQPSSSIPVAVIPTDEELMIALDTVRILGL